jgi:hypothetical protein
MRTIEIPPGTEIDRACEMAVEAVWRHPDRDPCSFTFNGVKVEVHQGMTVDEIAEKAWQGKAAKARYEAAKFESDFRNAIWEALPEGMDSDKDVDRAITLIRPFLRSP